MGLISDVANYRCGHLTSSIQAGLAYEVTMCIYSSHCSVEKVSKVVKSEAVGSGSSSGTEDTTVQYGGAAYGGALHRIAPPPSEQLHSLPVPLHAFFPIRPISLPPSFVLLAFVLLASTSLHFPHA